MVTLLPHIENEDDYIRVYKDPELWLPAAREICRRNGLSEDSLERTCTGTNIVYRVARHRIIKLFVPLWPKDVERERTALAAVTGTDLVTPELIVEDAIEGWPYVIMTELSGEPISEVWQSLSPKNQLDLAVEIGRIMKELHDLPADDVAAIAVDWTQFLDERIRNFTSHHSRFGPPPEIVESAARFLTEVPIRDTVPEATRFIHADLTHDHFLVTREAGAWRLTGLIDFADAMVGHPYYEFIAPATFLTQRSPELQQAMLLAYGFAEEELTSELADMLTAYALLHRYGHLKQIITLCPGPPPTSFEELRRSLWAFD